MLKFIDLSNGHTYDGNPPYVFWFDGEQSTSLIYTKSIGVYCDKSSVKINIEDNDIFKLIDSKSLLNDPNDFKKSQKISLILNGESIDGGYFYIIYFSATSDEIGEVRCKFYIDDFEYIIGADFYNENESLYINLSNFGIEIPDSIQKAFYDSNIEEDKKDNILLNRKFKELLSNYWDVIACKGSYKSLINSFKWFEWGNVARIREIWKQNSTGIYSDRELRTVLDDLYNETLLNFSKTTYLSLYTSLQNIIKGVYDTEMNPKLEFISKKWTHEQLALKMSLLGSFYETFFMPIHLDILHSTIEDIVFTNTIKIHKGSIIDRIDNIYNFEYIEDDIEKVYTIGNVSAQVGPGTIFGVQWNGEEKYEDIYTIGVEKEYVDSVIDEFGIKTFGSQLYTGPGVIIPIHLSIPMNNHDSIKHSIISINIDGGEWVTKEFYTNLNKDIDFNLLCKIEGTYEIRMSFVSKSSKTYSKKLKFDVIDIDNMAINIYKVLHKPIITQEDIEGEYVNNFIMSKQPYDQNRQNSYIQYLPISKTGGSLKKNHVLVFKGDYTDDEWIKKNYFIFTKNATYKSIASTTKDMDQLYTICVSKKFNFDPKSWLDLYRNNDLYRSDYCYFPQFHKMYPLGGEKLLDYTIGDGVCLFVKPEFKFGHLIDEYEWIFENASTFKQIKLPSIQEPYIADKDEELEKGFYNIIFRYKLVNGKEHELKLNSAFLKK